MQPSSSRLQHDTLTICTLPHQLPTADCRSHRQYHQAAELRYLSDLSHKRQLQCAAGTVLLVRALLFPVVDRHSNSSSLCFSFALSLPLPLPLSLPRTHHPTNPTLAAAAPTLQERLRESIAARERSGQPGPPPELERVADVVPWLFMQAEDKDSLREALLIPQLFMVGWWLAATETETETETDTHTHTYRKKRLTLRIQGNKRITKTDRNITNRSLFPFPWAS